MLLFLSKKVYWFVRNIKLQYANEGFSHQARMMENAVVESFFFLFVCFFLCQFVSFPFYSFSQNQPQPPNLPHFEACHHCIATMLHKIGTSAVHTYFHTYLQLHRFHNFQLAQRPTVGPTDRQSLFQSCQSATKKLTMHENRDPIVLLAPDAVYQNELFSTIEK